MVKVFFGFSLAAALAFVGIVYFFVGHIFHSIILEGKKDWWKKTVRNKEESQFRG